MNQPARSDRGQQENVNAYFRLHSSYWKEIYAGNSVQAEIFRIRQAAVLDWIENLSLAPGSRVLEVGCGAGFLTIALARRGLQVFAIDSTEAMIAQTRQHAEESGVSESLSLAVGDVCALTFEDCSFDLVIAIGVIPWLAQPQQAMQEMARVTRPGGYVILTADNRYRLTYLLDPWMNPALATFRKRVRRLFEQVRLIRRTSSEARETLYDRRFIDEMVAGAILVKTRGITLGFGPFSFLGYKFIPASLATKLHRRLQRLADRNVPLLRTTGAQYLVMAIKPVSRSRAEPTGGEESVSGSAQVS
jgi:ubiquinone/menaquinone biosynthesis C-methylase UbiE